MRLRDLDFIVTTERELVRAPATVQPLHSAGLDTIAEALEGLQPYAPKENAPKSHQPPGFDYGRLER